MTHPLEPEPSPAQRPLDAPAVPAPNGRWPRWIVAVLRRRGAIHRASGGLPYRVTLPRPAAQGAASGAG